MSYEAALQRVSELRTLVGTEATPGGVGGAAVATEGAFDAQLAHAQASALARSGGAAQASPLSAAGVPVLTVADQYRMLGIAPPMAGPIPVGGMVGVPWGGAATGANMVALAQRELGVAESPNGSNESARIREYRTATAGAEDTPGPWCAYFVSWLAQQSGAPIGAGGNGTGYVPTLEAWGKQTGRYMEHGAGTPQPGDIVIFDWGGDGTPDHTGIVERIGSDGRIHTIEGNSSNAVRRRDYPGSTNDIRGYVRPG